MKEHRVSMKLDGPACTCGVYGCRLLVILPRPSTMAQLPRPSTMVDLTDLVDNGPRCELCRWPITGEYGPRCELHPRPFDTKCEGCDTPLNLAAMERGVTRCALCPPARDGAMRLAAYMVLVVVLLVLGWAWWLWE